MITPEPGTHLARVPCVNCGTAVHAIPERADTALCVACGREKAGAREVIPSPPPRAPHATHTKAIHHETNPGPVNLPLTVYCPRCTWRKKFPADTDIHTVLWMHTWVTHTPGAWLARRTRRP